MAEIFGFKLDLGKIGKWIVTGGMVLLVVSWIMYMYVNWLTTQKSLEYMFGSAGWVTVFSFAVVAADLGAMARVFTPETGRKEPRWIAVVTIIWLTVTVFDAIFNYYYVAVKMEQANVIAPASMQEHMWIFPFAVAFLIWAVQVGLAFAVALSIDNYIHRSGSSSAGGFRR